MINSNLSAQPLIIHYRRGEKTLCGLDIRGSQDGTWPHNETWTSGANQASVTCEGCRELLKADNSD